MPKQNGGEMIRAGQACSMSMSQSFGLGLSLSLPRANHLLRVPAARCRARTLARTACSERTSLAGGSFRCLPSLSKNESAIGASDFLLCLHGRSDGCSSFSPRDAGAERILCRAKNDLFSNREPEDDEAIIQVGRSVGLLSNSAPIPRHMTQGLINSIM